MEPLGLGLIGYGGFGSFCLEAFEALPDLRLVAVAELDPDRRADAATRWGVKTLAEAADLFAMPQVDIVHISTPPNTHVPLTIAAARAGKHVFCEKPLALSVDEGGEISAEAQANHVRWMVNYVLRYNPLNRRLQALLDSEILGRLHHLSLENWATDEPLKPGHWFWQPETCGGIWIEHGVHFFDLFNWLAGQEVEAVSATSRTRPDGCLDRVWALARYSGELVANFHHAFTQPARIEQTSIRLACRRGHADLYGWIPTRLRVEALLDEASLEVFQDWAAGEVQVLERYSGDQVRGWSSGAPYRATVRARAEFDLPQGKLAVYQESIRAAMADLITSIRIKEHVPTVSARDALASLAVAESATRAAQSGKWEPVKRVEASVLDPASVK